MLARQVKAAVGRPSLRSGQLQLLFGAQRLDRPERERIQAALEAAGLEPYPSLLEVDDGGSVTFGEGGRPPPPAGEASGALVPAQASSVARRFESAPAGPPPRRAESATVGEFARSTFDRVRRRLTERRAPVGPGHSATSNGHHGHAVGTAPPSSRDELDYSPAPSGAPAGELTAPSPNGAEGSAPEWEPLAEAGEGAASADAEDDARVAFAERESAPAPSPTEAGDDATAFGGEPASPFAPGRAPDNGADFSSHAGQPRGVHGFPPHGLHETGGRVLPQGFGEPARAPDAGVEAADEPRGAGMHAADPEARRLAEIAAVLVAAAALPVIGTSIAGWRFGASYLVLAVVATGWLVARAKRGHGSAAGAVRAMRTSPTAAGALRVTAVLTIVSVVAAALLALATGGGSASSGTSSARGAIGAFARIAAARAPASARRHRRQPRHRVARQPVVQPSNTPSTTSPSTSGLSGGTPSASGSSAAPSAGGGQSAGGGTRGLIEVPPGR